MDNKLFEVEPFHIFSESLIWQLNRDFYHKSGIEAWSKGIVPHQITSNSLVGRTYAELIIGFLKDLATKGETDETVYIIELGAGHGRLGYHILKHLEQITKLLDIKLPPYCYVLTDIVEENLQFFKEHPQLQSYFKTGQLDYAYYDAIDGTSIKLRHANHTINKADLNQALIALGNYFFDSIPNDLFHIKDGKLSLCSIALHSSKHPKSLELDQLIKDLKLTYEKEDMDKVFYDSDISNAILKDYQTKLSDSYLFFPEISMQCIHNLKSLSTKGLMLLSMDKGVHNLAKLDNKTKPEIITHGSFSLWVNYHALSRYCEAAGGKALFPSYSTFHLQVACLLFMENADDLKNTNAAYQHSVNDFGPDDFNTIKKLSYANISNLSLMHLIALMRLSAYDSTFFLKILPRIKKLIVRLSKEDRERLAQSLDLVWLYYFNIHESQDMALNIAGVFFELSLFKEALIYFQHSANVYGIEVDTCYNKILCHFQLRQDTQFSKSLADAKLLFPDSEVFNKLDKLDLSSV